MEKEVVPYEESLALAQIGFVQSCWHAYHDLTFPSKEDKHKLEIVHNLTSYTDSYAHQYVNPVLAPTYSQAFRWFREKYKLISGVRTYFNIDFFYEIYVSVSHEITSDSYNTYEEAEQACLRELIKIVKENKLW
jgi:hypothetical protein